MHPTSKRLAAHKKTLLALAALCAAPLAAAQSNVTLYGVVDLGIEQTRLSPGAKTTRLSSGIQSGSRWGLKGREDLGNGMFAAFQLETGIDASTGALGQGGLGFGRQSWVGLGGGFGTVKFGRQYVPLFLAMDTIDPFGTGLVGDGSGMAAVFPAYGVRMDNTINYSSPDLGGFSMEAAYGFGEVAGNASIGRQYGFSAVYDKAPFTAVAAYHHRGLIGPGNTDGGENKGVLLGGAYDLKVVKLHAALSDNRTDSAAGVNTGRSRDYMLGVSAPVGPFSVMASYIRHNDRMTPNADAKFWALGATYAMSKRTNLYTSYSRVSNESAGSTGSGVAGADISWINVGIRHRF